MDATSNTDRARRVRGLFDEVADLDPPDRDARLDVVERDDAALAEEVRQLLSAYGRADRILERLEGSDDPSGPGALHPGQTVSHYRIVGQLGAGGMGVVYRAEDTRLQRPVALKTLPAHLAADARAKERFLAEARAAAALDHPNVCTIYDVGETAGGHLFIAMAFCNGETLRDRVAGGPLAVGEAVAVAGQVARALGAAHARKVVHRDVKPANVMVAADGAVTVVDFGIAKVAGLDLTREGARLGTVAYMSPEQARGDPVDHRTDVWSLGVVLYEMLAGARPFAGDYEQAAVYAILHEEPRPLRARRPDVPAALARVVERALAKAPEDRYPTAEALLHDLEVVDAPDSALAPRPADAARPPGPAPRATASTTASLTADGARRQVTVVTSYLDGYARLVEHLPPDEVETVMGRVRVLADEVARRHGGEVHASDGDELVLVFGVAATHEDDAARAVRAARELHAHVRALGDEAGHAGPSLRLGTGIDTGRVVAQAGPDGTPRISGRTVQTAGALSGQAAPDEILATPETRRLVSAHFEAEPAGEVRLRGRSAPVTAYRIGAAAEAGGLDDAELTSYTGRDAELDALHRHLGRAVTGEGQFVAVVGEAGLGKSRFLHEFSRALDPDATQRLWGRCQSHGSDVPYLPFLDALRATFGLHGEAPDRPAARVAERATALSPDLEVYVPVYLHLLSLPDPEYPLPGHLGEEGLRRAIQEALAALFTLRAARGPVVMLFEDWHWADDASHRALAQLVEVAAAYPLLVVVTYRPGYGVAWEPPRAPASISLGPLGADASLAVLASALDCDRFPEDVGRALHERTGGNPFFLEEVARTLHEDGTLRVEGGRVTATRPLADADLPDTVQAVIQTRVDRLPADTQAVLRVASVVGRDFTDAVLGHVLADGASVRPALATLRAADLVQQTRVLPEATYRFKHALTQEAAYESLLAHQRKDLHGRVGAALEALSPDRHDELAEVLARHYGQAEVWAKAVEYGRAAAQKAFALGQYPEAYRAYERVREWLLRRPERPERQNALVEVLLELERLCERMGRRERQQALIDEVRAIVEPDGTVDQRATALQRQGDLLTLLDRYAEAEPPLEDALRLRRQAEDEEGERNVMRSLGMLCWRADRFDEAVAYNERALEIDRRRGDDKALVGDLSNLGHVLFGLGRYDEAARYFQESIDLADSDSTQLFALHGLARVHHERGDLERAKALHLRAIDLLQTNRLDFQRDSYFFLSMANILWDEGDHEASLRYSRDAAEGARRTGDAEALAMALQATSDRLLQLGRYAEAIPLLTEAAAQYATLLDPRLEALAWYAMAVCHERQHDDAAAQAAWDRAHTSFEQAGDEPGQLQALEGLAQTARRLGTDADAMRGHFAAALGLAERLADREAEGRLRNAAGIAAWERGAHEQALSHFRAGLACYQALGDAIHQALLFNSVGVTLRKLGRLDEAVVALEEGAATGRRAGEALLEGHALASLGEIAFDRGHHAEARDHFERSLGLRRAAGDRRGEGWMLYHLARTDAALGDSGPAREHVAQALQVAREQGDNDLAKACRQIDA